MTVRELLEQREHRILSPKAMFSDESKGRPYPEEIRISVDWGNSNLYDEDKIWEEYRQMVSMGLIAPEVALGWRFNLPSNTEAERQIIRARYMPQ